MNQDPPCANLTSYFLGELEPIELEHFLRHLATCRECGDQVQQLWPIHERLLAGDGLEGASLATPAFKTDILANATAATRHAHSRAPRPRWRNALHPLQSSKSAVGTVRFWTAGAAAVVLVVLGVVSVYRSTVPVAPSTETFVLAAESPQSRATGLVRIYPGGQSKQIWMHVAHLPSLSGWGCYDLWTLGANRQYHSLVEFVVNGAGSNTVAVRVPSSLGVAQLVLTKEPAWGDPSPRGPVVLRAHGQNNAAGA